MEIRSSLTRDIMDTRIILWGFPDSRLSHQYFQEKNFKIEKLDGMLSYPLSIFNRSNPEKEKEFYKGLVKSLKAILENWEKYKPIRGMIEDIFKLTKNAFSLNNLHRYTKRSVKKFVCLHVLLVGIVVSLGINSKEELQKIAEW